MAITCGVDWLLHHGRGRLSLVTRTAALSVAFLSQASCVPCLMLFMRGGNERAHCTQGRGARNTLGTSVTAELEL